MELEELVSFKMNEWMILLWTGWTRKKVDRSFSTILSSSTLIFATGRDKIRFWLHIFRTTSFFFHPFFSERKITRRAKNEPISWSLFVNDIRTEKTSTSPAAINTVLPAVASIFPKWSFTMKDWRKTTSKISTLPNTGHFSRNPALPENIRVQNNSTILNPKLVYRFPTRLIKKFVGQSQPALLDVSSANFRPAISKNPSRQNSSKI